MSLRIQTQAIIAKNFRVLFRNRADFASEFLVPLICGLALIAFKSIGTQFLQSYFPIFLPIGALGLSRKILVGFVSEKSERYKETQKIMGLSQTAYVLGWVITAYLRMLIVFIIMTACIMQIKDDLKHSDDDPVPSEGQVVLAYFLYCFATLNQTFAISTIFSQPKLAGELGSFIQAISAFIYYWLQTEETKGLFYLFSFLPQCGINIAMAPVLISFDSSTGIIFLLIDFFLYLVLYFYLDQVFPNEFGVRKHPLFFLQCLWRRKNRSVSVTDSFFRKPSSLNPVTSPLLNPSKKKEEKEDVLSPGNANKQGGKNRETYNVHNEQDFSSAKYHEPFLNENNLPQTVVIHGLCKYFGKTKAVNDVSFTLYQSQIFGMLGHNGAGKTTLINVLTGLYEKTRGSAKIYGLDLTEDIEEIRKYTGLCCQKDVLYDDLTVEEHLRLIATIKGVPDDLMSQELDFILLKCGLMPDRAKRTKIMNGGGKRKLSLGMALIGGSKLVFLDEPTSGLDPISRRGIWKILETLRNEERTIILTTHYLDEAEILSDRIGVISRGKLLTLGTPNFIKKNFGDGYHLDISKKNEGARIEFQDRKEELTQKVLSLIKDSKVDPQTTNDVLTFLLPFASQSQFPGLFGELEKYEFINIELNINSLEDAFVNIGLEEEKNEIEKQLRVSIGEDGENLAFLAKTPQYYFLSQLSAIFLRKVYVTFRNLTLFITYIFPIVLIIIGTFLCKSLFNSDPPTGATQDSWNFFKRFVFIIFLNVAYSFTSSIYVGLPVVERELNLKYALTVMGCRILPYWFGTFLFDFLVYFITIIILMIFLYIENLTFITDSMGAFMGIMIVFGFSYISFAYLCGFMFEKSNTAYKGFPLLFYFVFATLPWILATALSDSANKIFEVIFLIISPIFAMNRAYIYLSNSGSSVVNQGLVTDMNVIIVIMILQYLVFTSLTILIDTIKFKNFAGKKEGKRSPLVEPMLENPQPPVFPDSLVYSISEEVSQEAERAKQSNDPIKLVDLTKTYENGFQAIKGVSFGVSRNQIFGLLGPNGAGKSTTFNIITALIPKSTGSCQLKGNEVNRNMVSIFKDVGICPQFDCLWDNLTPTEHLFLFGRMKGLRGQELRRSVDYFLQTMQLGFFKDTKAGNLSGGNKRKLCVADALIGGPDLLFFDEPSTGLDPIARRFLWTTLSQSLKSRESSIVLTTHSMTEAESLCDNIGIMVNGRLVCFGSTQDLKTKYGEGYIITLKPKPGESVDELVLALYPKSQKTKNNKEGYVEFQIPMEGFSFFKTFEFLEKELLEKGRVSDFSISQASLEQIFLTFSQMQQGEAAKDVQDIRS